MALLGTSELSKIIIDLSLEDELSKLVPVGSKTVYNFHETFKVMMIFKLKNYRCKEKGMLIQK